MTALRICLAVSIALLTSAPAAGAATSFGLGEGQHPDVAVDENGTGHFVWDVSAEGPDPLHYCRVPKGNTACEGDQQFVLPVEATGKSSYVFAPGGGRILIVSHRCCSATTEGSWLLTSTDGGNSFSGPAHIGSEPNEDGAELGPGDAISAGTARSYQHMPLASSTPPPRHAELPPGFGLPLWGAVAVFRGSIPVVVASDGDNMSFSRYSGSGGLNMASSWVGPTPLTPAGSDLDSAGGPAGLVLIQQSGTPGSQQILARSFDGTSFSAPVAISETGNPIFAAVGAEAGSGRYHAVWNANAERPNELRWATSPDGMKWSRFATLIRGDEADRQFHYRVSAYGGSGFAVWDGNSPNSPVRAAPLVPLQRAGPPADEASVGNTVVELFAPGGCVAPDERFFLRVTSRTKRRIAGRRGRSRIRVVRFRFAGQRVVDRKAAFKGRFSTAGLQPGSVRVARARVRLRQILPPKRRYRRTLRAPVEIC